MAEPDDLRAGGKDSAPRRPDAAQPPAPAAPRAIPMVDERLDSRDLFATGRVVTISHCGQTYQLRLTAQNKLILTK